MGIGNEKFICPVHLSFDHFLPRVCREESSEASLKNWCPRFYCHSSLENSQKKLAYFVSSEKEKRREKWMDDRPETRAVSTRYAYLENSFQWLLFMLLFVDRVFPAVINAANKGNKFDSIEIIFKRGTKWELFPSKELDFSVFEFSEILCLPMISFEK